MKNLENTPKIYVGTYGQYNDGSLLGKWFDLSDYSDSQAFYKDCDKYHRNEFLPKLMCQDREYIPDFLISESWLHKDTFKYFETIAGMSSDSTEVFELYCNNNASWPGYRSEWIEELIDGFNESYQEYFGGIMKEAKIEFAYRYMEDAGMLSGT